MNNITNSSNKINVGIYGGSFNPIHNGHIGLINTVLENGAVDKIRILPCKYHVYNKELVDIEYRIDMIHKATRNIPEVVIDYTEAESENPNYTADTLKILKEKFPNENHSLILGSDIFKDIHTWGGHEYIRDTTPLIIVKRESGMNGISKGYNYNAENEKGFKLNAILNLDSDVSSSIVRSRIKTGESISDLVPKRVEEYIFKNKLYSNTMKSKEYKNPGTTADLIVSVENKILLIKRKHEPFKDYWALPGGFLENNKETIEEAAVRELMEETNIKANVSDLELLGVYSDPKRDPRGHVISHTYIVKKFTGKLKAGDDAKDFALFKEYPEKLAFDHAKILNDYKKYLEKNKK